MYANFDKTETFVRYIYIHGPSWLGFYEGQSLSDICSTITKVDAEHWQTFKDPCLILIKRKVRSGMIGIGILIGSTTFIGLLNACINISTYCIFSKILKSKSL